MTTNSRRQSKHTPYLLEVNGKIYGAYEEMETPRQIAQSLATYGGHAVIRHGDDKVWES